MTYRLGVDLGTTWTAAAIWEAGKAAIFPLGQQRAAIPSVVLLRADGTVLTGEAAIRRAISEPERVAREFKRRIGDPTPIIVAGTPYPAEALTARLLRSVIDQVATQQGRAPEQVVISHPANWGAYKLELLTDIARRADLDPAECAFITEPEAAAISYASRQRVGIGQNACVFDLGGGTFDVALLQRTPVGFAILGRPDGIERLGGIDFDAAIYAHVTSNLGQHYTELDPEDPLTLSAIARLRQDCVEAKEALSADTDTTIPVLLPNYQTEMRLTRAEFEQLIRPPLLDTIETTRRAIASAGLETSEIHHVLLVGGSSRIPLISQLVQRELNLPTSVDADPKHAIAVGAATLRLPPPQDGTGAPLAAAASVSPPPAPGPPAVAPPAP
ncbi:MAG: Hsp70 family protein, partial [Acidimicrobiia bacterium]|nr:Hsp70 family protein [Acidimicrobiia bacterium]